MNDAVNTVKIIIVITIFVISQKYFMISFKISTIIIIAIIEIIINEVSISL